MDELAKRLREAAIVADSGNEISESLYSDIMQAADAIEELSKRPEDCPLVPVKAPHGRLIDADALVRDNGIKKIPEYYEVVRAAPTILEEEEDE